MTARRADGVAVTQRPPTKRAVKQPADRQRSAARRASVEVAGVEALDLDAMEPARNHDVVHLFTLDGTDYFIPREPRANVTLKYLRMARHDAASAQGWLLEQMLGEDGYTALMEWDGLTTAILLKLLAVVERLAVDASEAVSGPLGRG